jgi:hypothetical protein
MSALGAAMFVEWSDSKWHQPIGAACSRFRLRDMPLLRSLGHFLFTFSINHDAPLALNLRYSPLHSCAWYCKCFRRQASQRSDAKQIPRKKIAAQKPKRETAELPARVRFRSRGKSRGCLFRRRLRPCRKRPPPHWYALRPCLATAAKTGLKLKIRLHRTLKSFLLYE